jgi:toxin ParE1/3/4
VESLWLPRLGAEAERDLTDIVRWTARHFGAAQARFYRQAILAAIRDLENGPDTPGSKARDEILPGLRTLHVARHGRRGRHFLMYRASGHHIDILRILHDSMELGRHLPGSAGGGAKPPQPRGEG